MPVLLEQEGAAMKAVLLTLLAALLVLIAGFAAWVRLAPHPAARFHKTTEPQDEGDWPAPGGFEAVRAVTGDAQAVLARLDAIIRATPRTRPLAGSVAQGHRSYVTRSALWGFPDTTNVWVADGLLHIHGHLRFGRSDLGVNRVRITGWLAALGQL
ncbi:DUF1499 domain-containing protein [Actibacterium sp. D379-3]